jgi:hypothetical protein
MNHTLTLKPMCYDQARVIVQTTNRNTAAQRTEVSKPAKRVAPAIDLSKPSAAANAESEGAKQRKQVWWRQLVMAESLIATTKSSRRMG